MTEAELPEIPIFQDLTKGQIDELSSWLRRIEFRAGQEIFPEGSPPNGLYVLARGTVAVVGKNDAGLCVLTQLQGPSVFGEMGFLTAESHSAGIRAEGQVVCGLLPIELFEEKLQQNNITALRIAYNIGRIACQRLRATTHKLLLLSDAFGGGETVAAPGGRKVSQRLTDICRGILRENQSRP
jgi:CRP-like cAMP-binding protein